MNNEINIDGIIYVRKDSIKGLTTLTEIKKTLDELSFTDYLSVVAETNYLKLTRYSNVSITFIADNPTSVISTLIAINKAISAYRD